MAKKQSHIKRNWDLYSAIVITLLGALITWLMLQNCHDWGCLSLILIFLIGFIISDIFIGIAIYRQLTKKLSNLRWIIILIFIGFTFYFLTKITGGLILNGTRKSFKI